MARGEDTGSHIGRLVGRTAWGQRRDMLKTVESDAIDAGYSTFDKEYNEKMGRYRTSGTPTMSKMTLQEKSDLASSIARNHQDNATFNHVAKTSDAAENKYADLKEQRRTKKGKEDRPSSKDVRGAKKDAKALNKLTNTVGRWDYFEQD